MGDPAGIGSEIMLKGLDEIARRENPPNFTPIVYGDRATIMATSRALDISLQIVDPSANAPWPALRVVEIGPARETIALGSVSAEAGRLAYIAVERAVADAIDRRIDAIVTGPISKEALNLAGYAYPGHTEMLAELTKSADTCMMLTHGNLRVSHVSTHVALSRVPGLVTHERLTRVIELTLGALKIFGVSEPRIGVAALNPHAGEAGLFGHEDAEVIAPTVAEIRARGVRISGPIWATPSSCAGWPANSMRSSRCSTIRAIPVKLLGFQIDPASGKWTALSGVNLTLGLPFVRASVDHGTAFDIAGKGIASAQSMIETIEVALQMSA